MDFSTLDNPIWHALATGHRSLARTSGLAVRYPRDVSPFAAFESPTPQAFADLAALVAQEEVVALCTSEPLSLPDGWQIVRSRPIEQMVCPALKLNPESTFAELHDA